MLQDCPGYGDSALLEVAQLVVEHFAASKSGDGPYYCVSCVKLILRIGVAVQVAQGENPLVHRQGGDAGDGADLLAVLEDRGAG